MPKRNYRQARQSYRRRSTYRARRNTRARRSYYSRSRKTSLIPRSLRSKWANPLPNRKMYKFVYNDEGFTVDTGVGYVNTVIFRANSLFDPDYSGVGVQPYGFDQLFTANGPYNQYQVLASKITVYIHANPSANKSPVKVTILPWLGTEFPTYLETSDLLRHNGARSNLIDLTKDDTRECKVSNYTSIARHSYNGQLDEDYSAQYTTNPTKQVFWYISFSTQTTAIASCEYRYDVKITYYTRASQTHADINES